MIKKCEASTSENIEKICLKFYQEIWKRCFLSKLVLHNFFCLKFMGNLKSKKNILTLYLDKFFKSFGQKHWLENYYSQVL